MILVTGSAGHLGEALMRHYQSQGQAVRGIDLLESAYTHMVGSIADRTFVARAMQGVQAVLHTATLHKPHVATHSRQQFIDTNITGTLHLLEEAVLQGVRGFIYTSTTSAFGDAMTPVKPAPAVWVTEDLMVRPKNIYGVSKTAAEDLCALFARNMGLSCIVLRTSRFFPEADDQAEQRQRYSDDNLKVVEFLHRRVAIDDVVSAHECALQRASRLGFGKYIISATSPFQIEDLPALRVNVAEVLERYVPGAKDWFADLGWTFPNDIDRVYVNHRARHDLQWQPQENFQTALQRFLATRNWRTELALRIGKKGYHEQDFGDIPFPVE